MKTHTFPSSVPLAFGLALALGASVYAASLWHDPTSTAPGNNMDAPVHVGNDQVKQIGSSASNAGGLSVNSFIAGANSYFDQQTFFQGPLVGVSVSANGSVTPSSTIAIGGSANKVDVVSTGDVSTVSFIQSHAVANTSSKTLCADGNGSIIICP